MDAKQLISAIDIDVVLDHYNFKHQRKDGDFIRSACAIHGGDNPTSFVINSQTSLWYCHTGCGGGDIFTLVRKMENCSFVEAVQWIADFFKIDLEGFNIEARESEIKKELAQWMEYNKRLRNAEPIKACSIRPETKQIAKLRTFRKETLDDFEIGFIDKIQLINKKGEAYTLFNRIFFPIYFDEKYVGFSLRRVEESDIMKWSHQPRDFNVGRILYNYDNVADEEEIIIVEGIYDVLAFVEIGIPAVCTFGSNLSTEQRDLLLKTGADITFAYDGDDAGRKATEKAVEMLRNKATLRLVDFGDGEDPESITREKLFDLFKERKRIH